MLRLVVGNDFDRRIIYKAISVLDSDGDKNISLQELLLFIYKIWKTQLDDLSEKMSTLQEGDERVVKIMRERDDIKEAIKRNYARAWRDSVERNGHSIPGPFSSLLTHLGLERTKPNVQTQTLNRMTHSMSVSENQYGTNTNTSGHNHNHNQMSDGAYSSTYGTQSLQDLSPIKASTLTRPFPFSSSLPSSNQYGAVNKYNINNNMNNNSNNNINSNNSRSGGNNNGNINGGGNGGHNGLLRFKIKLAPNSNSMSGPGSSLGSLSNTSHRTGLTLTLPVVKNLNQENFISAEAAPSLLKKYEPGGSKLFSMSY